MDIEVGEWVRTNDGYLGKLIAINKQDYNYLVIDTTKDIRNDKYPATYLYLKNENIAKHSKDIIDLIEEGDYVNGKKVERINDYGEHKRADFNLDFDDCDAVYNEDIKTILTHEQYEQNCYRMEEN